MKILHLNFIYDMCSKCDISMHIAVWWIGHQLFGYFCSPEWLQNSWSGLGAFVKSAVLV